MLGSFGEVIVLDWGLAKMVDSPGADDGIAGRGPDRRGAGGCDHGRPRLGTPAYMAPEQAEGRTDLVNALTDIYGLGGILFEILTGRPPSFRGHLHRSSCSTASSIPRDAERQDARTVRPRRSRPSAPGDGPGAIRSVSKTAQELADDVQRWLADEKVEAYRENARERIARWTKRLRWTPAAAVLLVTIATISTMAIRGRERQGPEEAEARRQEAAARRLVNEQNSMEERRIQALQAAVQDDVVAGQAALSAQDWDRAVERLDGALRLIRNEPRLAPLRPVPQRLYDRASKAHDERNADREAGERLARFRRLHDDALFHGTFLSGVHLLFDHEAARTAATAALDLMAVPREPGRVFKPRSPLFTGPEPPPDRGMPAVADDPRRRRVPPLPGRPPGDPRGGPSSP